MLFQRVITTRLPHLSTGQPPAIVQEARQHEMRQKQAQKGNKDSKAYVKHHTLKKGDHVLLEQNQTKMHPPYDPKPYEVTEIRGHQITIERDGCSKNRDAKQLKPVTSKQSTNHHRNNKPTGPKEEDSIVEQKKTTTKIAEQEKTTTQQDQPANTISEKQASPNQHEHRNRPVRMRKQPAYLQGYETNL